MSMKTGKALLASREVDYNQAARERHLQTVAAIGPKNTASRVSSLCSGVIRGHHHRGQIGAFQD